MKKAFIPLMALLFVFGGCVRSSTLKRAINETDAARLEAASAEKANKSHLEEIASIKKDLEELRTRNEGLVEGNLNKSEQIASLRAVLKGKAKENADLRKELDALRADGLPAKGAVEIDHPGMDVYGELFKALQEDIDMGSLSIIRGAKTLSLLISEKALFESKGAVLLPEGKALLQRISSARDNLKFSGKHIQIRPISPSLKGGNENAAKGLAVKRGAVITRFLNERADVKKAAHNGLPYEESASTTFSGFAVELVFPYGE